MLRQDSDGVTVRIESGSAILKFNYFDTVRVSACDVSGYSVTDDISFIKLDNCPPNTDVRIYGKTLSEWFLGS